MTVVNNPSIEHVYTNYVLVPVFSSVEYIPRSRIAGAYGGCV